MNYQYNSYANCPWVYSNQGIPPAWDYSSCGGTQNALYSSPVALSQPRNCADDVKLPHSDDSTHSQPCSNIGKIVISDTEPETDSPTEEPVLVTASVKIICQNEKRNEHKTYILRDINIKRMKQVSSLK